MAVPIAARKRWTLRELHSLPDDGNTYELIHGELFVTPPPTDEHETIAAVLTRMLDPFVARNGLGLIYRPKAVFRYRGSEVEPDLMVRARAPRRIRNDWERAPKPILIVEVLSPSTRRRDVEHKREFYMSIRIPEYWFVDPEARSITSVRPGKDDIVSLEQLVWNPAGCAERFTLDVGQLFVQSLGS